MSITRKRLEAIQRADWLRLKSGSSSMHPSWRDAAALAEATRAFRQSCLTQSDQGSELKAPKEISDETSADTPKGQIED